MTYPIFPPSKAIQLIKDKNPNRIFLTVEYMTLTELTDLAEEYNYEIEFDTGYINVVGLYKKNNGA